MTRYKSSNKTKKLPNEAFHRIGEERRSPPGELHVMAQGIMMKKHKLLKKSLLLASAAGLIGLILCAVYIQNDTSLDSLQKVTAQTISSELPEQIKIGVIGDSWVAGQKLDRAIEQAVAASGFENAVSSSGHPGAKSRQIYRNLFLETATKNSSNAMFIDEDLDYLVIVAGVNDSGYCQLNCVNSFSCFNWGKLGRTFPIFVDLQLNSIFNDINARRR